MRIMERNKRRFWYLLFDQTEVVADEYGNETDPVAVYKDAAEMRANVSAATGASQVEQFGSLTGYDKVIVTDDMTCPIDENSVLFLDKRPEYGEEDGQPLYDYMVRRVAKSLNSISIAVTKVSVS